ncbi:hypothetical protein [Pseudomonas sp. NPDC096950]|uniref:hypothetical protein n=1 Tax=Pseudomonas sp. NPDC096950 TaxID=3364485 RepID=UPI00383B99A5
MNIALRAAGFSIMATFVSCGVGAQAQGLDPHIGGEFKTCASGLARESGGSANTAFECAGLFASKPAPTGIVQHSIQRTPYAH